MGPPGDPTAVVGPDLRVRGFDNLRVADTSIYPDNVMHNTNLTAIVVGEMAARFIDQAQRLNSLRAEERTDGPRFARDLVSPVRKAALCLAGA